MSDLTREELEELLDRSEHNLLEANERWDKLKDKIARHLKRVEADADRCCKQLVSSAVGLGSLPMVQSQEHKKLTMDLLLNTEEARRSYAVYDAFRTVKIMMGGYL